MASFRFVDVSGVGNSGKTAVVDLLREVDCVHAPPYWFEFDFIRIPNGLLDLRHRIVNDWSPTRSHYGIKAFRHAALQMGIDSARWDIVGMLKSTSQRYDRYFGGQFVRLTNEFADSFVLVTYLAEWPYDDMQIGPWWRLLRKIGIKAGFRSSLRREVIVPDGADFDARATSYLNQLFSLRVQAGCEVVVLNNGIEPYNPVPGLDMIMGAKQIVVVRDPRDVYVSGLNQHKVSAKDKGLLPFDNDGMNKSFLATDNLSDFVRRQRIFYDHVYGGDDPRVLRIRFEDLCLRYDETVAQIFAFCGISAGRHIAPRTSFVPERSRSGVGLWRNYSQKDEIDFIVRELPDLVYPGEVAS